MATKLGELIAFLCLSLLSTLMSALALVFCLCDCTKIIITSLPDGSEELHLIFPRVQCREDLVTKAEGLVYLLYESGEQRTKIGSATSISVFGIDVAKV